MQRRESTLDLFGQHCLRLAQLLKEEGPPFTPEQHLFIENNLLAVQLALAVSKISSRQTPSARNE